MKRIVFLISILLMLSLAQAACNDCFLKIVPVSNNICPGDSAMYKIKLTNAYDQTRAISLSASSDSELITDLPSQVILSPYETRTIEAKFTPVAPSIGTYRLRIEASGYGADDSDDAIFVIGECDFFDAALDSQSLELCEGVSKDIRLTVINTGSRGDTYSLTVGNIPPGLDVSFTGGTTVLQPLESETFVLNVQNQGAAYGLHTLQLKLSSQTKTQTIDYPIYISDCYESEILSNTDFVTCPQAGLSYTAKITNKGPLPNTYDLSPSGTCGARTLPQSLELQPGESKDVTVTLSSSIGECESVIEARSDYDTISSSTRVDVRNCYDVDLEILPSKSLACYGEPVNYRLRITNTGYYDDIYDLSLGGIDIPLNPSTISLQRGQTGFVDFAIAGTWCLEGNV
jgi:uncharacterized membrane protein